MKSWWAALSVLICAPGWAQDCPPHGWNRSQLESLRDSRFEIARSPSREALARALTACLASPDPFLRDRIAYEGLAHMLRAGSLSAGTRNHIARDLLARLASRDPGGFEAPFAALVLSEVVRADNRAPFLPAELRSAIADAAIDYVRNLGDYRGFDEQEGWRHGVAHGADLLARIAGSPAVSDPERLMRLRDAIAAQVAPPGHFYIYGEPERLVLPVIALARRGIVSEAAWAAWFERLAAPAPFAAWNDVFGSQAGLAKRHNLRAFLYALWLNARMGSNVEDDVLLAGAEAALRAVP